MHKYDYMKPKLIAMTTHMDKFATINLIHALLDEKLSKDLIRSSISILLNTRVIDVRLDEIKIKSKMDFFKNI